MTYTYRDYMNALDGAGIKLKEIVLDKAAHDESISLEELVRLVAYAYPDS